MPRRVNRLVFLIHPLTWAANAHRPDFVAQYQEYLDYERTIKERWWQGIGDMASKPDEALIIGSPDCPRELEEYAAVQLGDRAVILKDVLCQQPSLWDELLTDQMKTGLGRDLLAMFWRHGFTWQSDELVHPVICRGWADRTRRHFRDRGMTFNPRTVEAEGWGESFEGCASSYARYLGSYLGLEHPVEVVFEMTVPDFRVLFRARYLGRIPLARNVRLYLWQGEDGRQIARFHKALASVGDPTLCARFPLGSMQVEVRNYSHLLWPIKDSEVAWQDGDLIVPIWSGRTFPSVGGNGFILAQGVPPEAFRGALSNAELVEQDIPRGPLG